MISFQHSEGSRLGNEIVVIEFLASDLNLASGVGEVHGLHVGDQLAPRSRGLNTGRILKGDEERKAASRATEFGHNFLSFFHPGPGVLLSSGVVHGNGESSLRRDNTHRN